MPFLCFGGKGQKTSIVSTRNFCGPPFFIAGEEPEQRGIEISPEPDFFNLEKRKTLRKD
jgi:hypothetical protein